MNDVPKEEGGGTTFQRLNITNTPKKNEVLNFYNLHKNGTGHELSLHSGDLILGNNTVKWAITSWVRTKYIPNKEDL